MRAKEILSELHMAPSRLMQFASSPAAENMLAGFEVEVILPGEYSGDDYETEPDYNYDEMLPDNIEISDIRDFFQIGSHDQRALRRLLDEHDGWIEERYSDYKDDNWSDMEENVRENSPELDDDEVTSMVEEKLTHQFYHFDAPDLIEFFNDNSIRAWSDIANEFNLDWPYFTEVGNNFEDETFGYARDLKKEVGYPVVITGEYHGSTRQPGVWYMEPDASIEPDSRDYMGVEIISCPMPVLEMLDKLDETLQWVEYNNGVTNESTGLHIGVSIKGMVASEIDYIKLALFLGDRYVLEQFDRAANHYAKSAVEVISNTLLKKIPSDPGPQLAELKAGLLGSVSKSILSRNQDKYTSINMHHEYVEFRSMGGDYLNKFATIKNTILRYVRAYAVAADPQAERKEYARKLSKLLSSAQAYGSRDPIKWFMLYTTGSITKEQLIRAVKAYRQEKINAKTQVKEPEVDQTIQTPAVTPPELGWYANNANT